MSINNQQYFDYLILNTCKFVNGWVFIVGPFIFKTSVVGTVWFGLNICDICNAVDGINPKLFLFICKANPLKGCNALFVKSMLIEMRPFLRI